MTTCRAKHTVIIQTISKYHILKIWISWAENIMGKKNSQKLFRSTGLYWGSASIISLPGEIFAESAIRIRNILKSSDPLFILGYAFVTSITTQFQIPEIRIRELSLVLRYR